MRGQHLSIEGNRGNADEESKPIVLQCIKSSSDIYDIHLRMLMMISFLLVPVYKVYPADWCIQCVQSLIWTIVCTHSVYHTVLDTVYKVCKAYPADWCILCVQSVTRAWKRADTSSSPTSRLNTAMTMKRVEKGRGCKNEASDQDWCKGSTF